MAYIMVEATLGSSAYQELLGFVEEAVTVGPPAQRVKNLASLGDEVASEEGLEPAEREDLQRRIGQYRAETVLSDQEAAHDGGATGATAD